jgi:hypothetical protein
MTTIVDIEAGSPRRLQSVFAALVREIQRHPSRLLTAIMEGRANGFPDVKRIRILQLSLGAVDITFLLRSRSRGEIWGDPTG